MKEVNLKTKIFIYIFFVALALMVIVPFLWVIGNSFCVSEAIGKYGGLSIWAFIPKKLTMANYRQLFVKCDLYRILFNTVFVALTVTVCSLMLNSLAAYALARLNFRGKKVVFSIVLLTMIIPFEVMVIPLYHIVKQLKLIDSYGGLIMPVMASALGIFFFRQFFLEIPTSLEEAATIDGAGRFKIYKDIMLPLMKPPLVTMGIITFLQQWDNFLWAVTVINRDKYQLLQVALTYMATANEHITDWGVVFSGAVVSAVPIIIIFVFMQKYYIQSIATTGVKG